MKKDAESIKLRSYNVIVFHINQEVGLYSFKGFTQNKYSGIFAFTAVSHSIISQIFAVVEKCWYLFNGRKSSKYVLDTM